MNGLQEELVKELFELAKKHVLAVTYFEIYGGRCLDLLNEKNILQIMEDKHGNIQIPGLTEQNTESAKDLLQIMEMANANRTTHVTTSNDTSSRSHAICQVRETLLRFMSAARAMRRQGNWFWSTWLGVNEPKTLKATTANVESKGLRSTKGTCNSK